VLTGGLYPLIVTGSRGTVSREAAGSLLGRHGHAVGSSLIGQSFTAGALLEPPLGDHAQPYNASASAGSNLGP